VGGTLTGLLLIVVGGVGSAAMVLPGRLGGSPALLPSTGDAATPAQRQAQTPPDRRDRDDRPTRRSAPRITVVNGRAQPPAVPVSRAASGTYLVAKGAARAPGRGPVIRYLVEMERGLPFDPQQFAAEVHRILNHPAGWGQAGRIRFVRVASGPVRFRVSLSSPNLTDERCAPLRTLGRVSCFSRSRAVINAARWGGGSPTYGQDVASYREYLISHEVGHGLGRGHVSCPGLGAPAPVMVQQTKSLDGCRASPWPYP
jgi:hypothetical protein